MTVGADLLAFDPELPRRDALLDVSVVADRLPALLGVPAGTSVGPVERIRTKYRDGRSLRVLHRVPVAGTTRLVSTRMATAERIPRLAAAASAGGGEVAGLRAVVHDPELDAVSWVFPFDRKLSGLDGLVGEEAPVLELLGFGGAATNVVAYAPEKSVTLRCADRAGRVLAYVKVYADGERAAEAVARSRRIAEPAAAAALGLPHVVASLPARHVVVLEALPGRRLDHLDGADLSVGLRSLGRALARLHALPADAEPALERFRPDRVQGVADLLGRVRPDVGGTAQTLAARLGGDGPFPGTALLHGDVHLKNGLLDGDHVNLLDLDQFARGHPAADLGSLLAALRHRRLVGALTPGQQDELESAFLAGYAEHAEVDPVALRWHTAAALLVERAARAVHRVLPRTLTRLPALLLEADELLDAAAGRRKAS